MALIHKYIDANLSAINIWKSLCVSNRSCVYKHCFRVKSFLHRASTLRHQRFHVSGNNVVANSWAFFLHQHKYGLHVFFHAVAFEIVTVGVLQTIPISASIYLICQTRNIFRCFDLCASSQVEMRPLFMFANIILSREYSKTLTYDFKFLLGSITWRFDRPSLKWSRRSLPAVCFLSRCYGIFFRFASSRYHQVLCWNKRIIIEFISETSLFLGKNCGIVAATGRLSTGSPSRTPCSFASLWSHAALPTRESLNKAGVFSFFF